MFLRWNRKLQIGVLFLLSLSLIALLAPWFAPFDPLKISLEKELLPPSALHWLGCDANGTDIFSILLYGTRVSLSVGLIATLCSVSLGLLVGSLAGWSGSWIDSTLMRLLDIIFAFPGIILAIALASALGPSKYNLILCLVATGWAGYARLVRGEFLHLKKREFVEAAKALGLPRWRIIVFHIWPNLFSPLMVSASFGLAGTILAEASLSFLGVGLPPGTPSWGGLLSLGKDVMIEAPHVAMFPGLAIMLAVLGFNALGEGLREKLDPKSRFQR